MESNHHLQLGLHPGALPTYANQASVARCGYTLDVKLMNMLYFWEVYFQHVEVCSHCRNSMVALAVFLPKTKML